MLQALRQYRVSSRLWGLFAALTGSLLFTLFQGGKLALMLFIMLLVVTLYLLLGKWSGIKGTTGVRTLEDAETGTVLEAGGSVKVGLSLQIPGYWPIPYVMLKDRLVRRGGETLVFETSFAPDWRRRGRLIYATPPLGRGFYTFGETSCSTEDVFGFFEHKGKLTLPLTFSVLPKTVPIKDWVQFRHLSKGNQNRSTSTRQSRETTQINGVREYHYGDRLSRIHWNATARTGTWKSKEFEREALPKIVVVLDRQASSYRNPEQFELAVSTAASMLQFAGSKQLAAGLLSVGGSSAYYEPSIGNAKLKEMNHHLIEVQADGKHELVRVIEDRAKQLPNGSLLVVVSPKTGPAALQALSWSQTRQLTPCQIIIGRQDAGAFYEDWGKVLRSKGFVHYVVQELHELPAVLGGGGR